MHHKMYTCTKTIFIIFILFSLVDNEHYMQGVQFCNFEKNKKEKKKLTNKNIL